MRSKLIVLTFPLLLSCQQKKNLLSEFKTVPVKNELLSQNPYKMILEIPLPAGYRRITGEPGSFAEWLRNLQLKKDKRVYKFDGRLKYNQTAQFAIVNMTVGNKDLQQCADAVMRLRAEYFYFHNEFNKINFTDNNGKSYPFREPYNRNAFQKYLELVFSMCGTASLAKQLTTHVELKDMIPGDVLIRGGFPGHAEIVMDVAVNDAGKKIFLLAQSYMPAQDFHVLRNPLSTFSPWYEVGDDLQIQTPEYTFSKYELKRW